MVPLCVSPPWHFPSSSLPQRLELHQKWFGLNLWVELVSQSATIEHFQHQGRNGFSYSSRGQRSETKVSKQGYLVPLPRFLSLPELIVPFARGCIAPCPAVVCIWPLPRVNPIFCTIEKALVVFRTYLADLRRPCLTIFKSVIVQVSLCCHGKHSDLTQFRGGIDSFQLTDYSPSSREVKAGT